MEDSKGGNIMKKINTVLLCSIVILLLILNIGFLKGYFYLPGRFRLLRTEYDLLKVDKSALMIYTTKKILLKIDTATGKMWS